MREQSASHSFQPESRSLLTLGVVRLLVPLVGLLLMTGGFVISAAAQKLATIPPDSIRVSHEAASAKPECDPGLWPHVYSPERLSRIEECVTVAGTVEAVPNALTDPDGDYKFLLRPDPPYRNMLNGLNQIVYRGDLVIEVVCAIRTRQAEPLAACAGYHNTVIFPAAGEHVQITGSYVFDRLLFGRYGWMEIHPVSKIEPME